MNLKICIALTASLILSRGVAQPVHRLSKAPIDTNIFQKDGTGNIWQQLQDEQISGDGRYVHYEINNDPLPGKTTQVLCSSDNKWQRSWVTTDGYGLFSADGRWFVFNGWRDTVYTYQMGTDEKLTFPGVNRFEISRKANSCIAYLSNDKKLHLRDLNNASEKTFNRTSEFQFTPNGDLLYQTLPDGGGTSRLMGYSPDNSGGALRKLAEADRPFPLQHLVFNADESVFAFIRQQKNKDTGAPENELWLYNSDGKGHRLACKGLNIPDSLYISNDRPGFSDDGKRILIQLKEIAAAMPHPPLPASAVLVDVWRYRDILGQTEQLHDPWNADEKYPAVVDLETGKALVAGNDDRHFGDVSNNNSNSRTLQYLLYSNASASRDYWWHKDRLPTVYLLNTLTGAYVPVRRNIRYYPDRTNPTDLQFYLSPRERYVLYFDPLGKGYCSYEIAKRKTSAISSGIPVASFYNAGFVDNSIDPRFQRPEGIIGWLKDDEGVLVSDNYDIWLLDLAGKHAPINVTCGYGRKHHVVFHREGKDPSFDIVDSIDPDRSLILTSFNEHTKYQGFYRASLRKPEQPLELSSGPYWCTGLEKAGDTWMVTRQSTDEAPNLYSSKDLKTFTSLSNISPQKNYNWITAELVNYKLPDGKLCQGILYKPKDFDPKKNTRSFFAIMKDCRMNCTNSSSQSCSEMPLKCLSIPTEVT
jgi:hypothetical protein